MDEEPVITRTTWAIENASHVILRELVFNDCPSPSIVIGPRASDNLVQNNRFLNCPRLHGDLSERTTWERTPARHTAAIIDAEAIVKRFADAAKGY